MTDPKKPVSQEMDIKDLDETYDFAAFDENDASSEAFEGSSLFMEDDLLEQDDVFSKPLHTTPAGQGAERLGIGAFENPKFGDELPEYGFANDQAYDEGRLGVQMTDETMGEQMMPPSQKKDGVSAWLQSSLSWLNTHRAVAFAGILLLVFGGYQGVVWLFTPSPKAPITKPSVLEASIRENAALKTAQKETPAQQLLASEQKAAAQALAKVTPAGLVGSTPETGSQATQGDQPVAPQVTPVIAGEAAGLSSSAIPATGIPATSAAIPTATPAPSGLALPVAGTTLPASVAPPMPSPSSPPSPPSSAKPLIMSTGSAPLPPLPISGLPAGSTALVPMASPQAVTGNMAGATLVGPVSAGAVQYPQQYGAPLGGGVTAELQRLESSITALNMQLSTVSDVYKRLVEMERSLQGISDETHHMNGILNQKVMEFTVVEQKLNSIEEEMNNVREDLAQQSTIAIQAQRATNMTREALQAREKSAALHLVVQAAIPGRAWLRSDIGELFTVVPGDEVPGYGRVMVIDPVTGTVATSTGDVLREQ